MAIPILCSGTLARLGSGFALLAALALGMTDSALADVSISSASWDSGSGGFTARGRASRGTEPVTVTNADTGALVGEDNRIRERRWSVRTTISEPTSVPCRVRAAASDGTSAVRDVDGAPANCDDGSGGGPGTPPDAGLPNQTDYKIMMNYELGMHCTGFEFAYCCVLPVYNSILAQVVKPEGTDGADFPELLEGDPNVGLDALGRETVVRDKAVDSNGNFKKYVMRYWHDAQPRNDGRGKVQKSTLISAVEGNSLMAWNTNFDSALVVDGALQYDDYNGSTGVVQGDGDFDDVSDNYQNAVWNHLYFYSNNGGPPLEGENPNDSSLEADKIRLGVSGQPIMDVVFPPDCGPALHPMGPVTQGGDPNDATVANDCGGFANGNVLTFSGDKGTVVYTQMKVLENLPVMLTSPDIWEALGLPLTTFEDSIDFFSDPGLVDEDSVRPFVAMKAQMFDYASGAAVLDGAGVPVIGFGTAPIDIPNCERCHSNPADGAFVTIPASESAGIVDEDSTQPGVQMTVANSPNNDPAQYALVKQEYDYWSAYYNIDTGAGDSDWYSRLKSAAISMLNAHDIQHGTSFAANYPGSDVAGELPQNTRLGHESVICQRCHADNVIAVVKSANCGAGSNPLNDPSACAEGDLIPPITEAIHINHDNVANGGPITFADSLGREGGCQGCHPAHRSNGDMDGYPITLAGTNRYADGDNRGASGGCFVGRDVHSNPGKDSDGAETPEHLNAVGQWLADNVSNSPTENTGIWCTNCHNQLGQEIWKTENVASLVHGTGICSDGVTACQNDGDCNGADTCALNNPRGAPTLAAVAAAVGTTEAQAIAWLDPTDSNPLGDFSHAIWAADPGLCDYVDNVLIGGQPANPAHDGNVATIEVHAGGSCSTGYVDGPNLATAFGCNTPATLCGTFDGDGDFSVHIMDFCTTPDCVAAAQNKLNADPVANNALAVPVPMSAATDGRDHWLAPGEPHCADCHAAPYVEQSGNINPYPPFNYPRKASLMRYSKGHQGITCQGCHESIHGLYPVTPTIDTTSYAQAAGLNHDGSHGPLKCGTCHEVGNDDIPNWVDELRYNGQSIGSNFDRAVSWMHTFTAEADPRQDVCLNCHGDESDEVSWNEEEWVEHAWRGRTSRQTMDTVEILEQGFVSGDPDFQNPLTTVCRQCHGDESDEVQCSGGDGREWKEHLTEGRVAEKVWTYVSQQLTGSTCGW